ncbi:DUF4331 family protein [Streptomyces sp. NPDC021093]|uniref:DUF4331 family protein n=1 Tax=Streptomyces sp. NPDC021093 TaxID=3365112 RepID=UPI00378FE04A
MAHHVSGLGISPTSMDPRSNISDLYAFQKPSDASKTILVMNINPTSPITDDAVDHKSVYEFGVDTDADAVTDIAFRIRFSPVRDNAQTASLQRATGREAAADPDAGDTILADVPVTFDSEPQISGAGGFRFFAGLRRDPFFADPVGANDKSQWIGTDFFADKHVSSIVLEVPNSALGPNPHVGTWASGSWSWSRTMAAWSRATAPGDPESTTTSTRTPPRIRH